MSRRRTDLGGFYFNLIFSLGVLGVYMLTGAEFLLIVMALISILATMAVVQYRNGVRRAEESVLKTDLFRMRDAIDQYYADKNRYPPSLDALVTEKYLRAIPEDPFTNSADTWQTVMSDPDPANPNAAPGVYDVKSGAEGTSISGAMPPSRPSRLS